MLLQWKLCDASYSGNTTLSLRAPQTRWVLFFCFIIVVETYFHTCRRRSSDTLAVFGLAPLNAVDLVQHALLSRPQLVVGGQRERSILRDPDGCRWSQRLRSHHLPNSAPLLWTDRQNGLPEKRRPGGKIKSAPKAVTAALSMVVLGAVGYNSTLGTAPGRESSQKGVVCKEEPRKAGVPLRSTRYTCGGGALMLLFLKLKIEN